MFNFSSNPMTVQPTEKNPGKYEFRNQIFKSLGEGLGTLIGSSYKQKKESPILNEILSEYQQAVEEDRPTSGIIARILGSGLSEDTQTKAIAAISQAEKVRSEDRAIRSKESATAAQLGYYEKKLNADIEARRQQLDFENYKLEQTVRGSKYSADIKAYGEYFKSQLDQIDEMMVPPEEKARRKESVIDQWNGTLEELRQQFNGPSSPELSQTPSEIPIAEQEVQQDENISQLAPGNQESSLMRENPMLFDEVEAYKSGDINSMQFLTRSYMTSRANPEMFARALQEVDDGAILEDMSQYYLDGGSDYIDNILDKEGAKIIEAQYPGLAKSIEMAALNNISVSQLHEKGLTDSDLRRLMIKYRNLPKYERNAKVVKDALKEAL